MRDTSIVYGNTGRVKVHHPGHGTLVPEVVFHWVGGRNARSILDALHLATGLSTPFTRGANELPEFGPETAGHLAKHIMELARRLR